MFVAVVVLLVVVARLPKKERETRKTARRPDPLCKETQEALHESFVFVPINKFEASMTMRRSRSSPAPLLRTRFSISEDQINDSLDEKTATAALWSTAVEVIRGVTQALSHDEDDDTTAEERSRPRESEQEYDCEEEEEEDVYAQGMRNLLMSLDKNFQPETAKKFESEESTSSNHDPVMTVLQKSLFLAKPVKKKKKKYLRVRVTSNDFHSRLPDIDEDRSLHVSPSLDDEYPLQLTDTSMSSTSSVERNQKHKTKGSGEEEEGSWKEQVRVQSQLPNVEVLLLRRASSLSRTGSLQSTHSLAPSVRSNGSTHDGSEYYYDDEYDDDDGFSAFTRLQSYSSLQTNASSASYAFQEVDEEDDILADCHTFSWFGK